MACGPFEVGSTGNMNSDISRVLPATSSVMFFPSLKFTINVFSFLSAWRAHKGAIRGKTWPCFQEEPPDLDDECIPDLGQWAFVNHSFCQL